MNAPMTLQLAVDSNATILKSALESTQFCSRRATHSDLQQFSCTAFVRMKPNKTVLFNFSSRQPGFSQQSKVSTVANYDGNGPR